MNHRALTRLVAPTVALGLAVSGCSSDASSEPPADPAPTSASPSPTPTASPEPSTPPAPTLPAEAQGTSARAAKAFARHYFALINHAAATGDTAELRRLGDEDCVSCEAIASNIERVYGAGGRILEENWQIESVRVLSEGRQPVLSLGVRIAPEVILQADGTRDRREGSKQPMTMFLDTNGGGLMVSKLDLVS